MVNPPEYDDLILKKLEELPEKWNRKKKEITLELIVQKEDATWISSRIYEDVSRGLISTKIHAKHSEHSVDLTVTLVVNLDVTPIIIALSLLLTELKTKMISRYLSKKRKDRRRRRKMKN